MPAFYIGLMSGTSLDGIDAALLDLGGSTFRLVNHHTTPLPRELRQILLALCSSGADEIERMGRADRELAHLLAESALAVCKAAGVKPGDIVAIGSHGQTIRHRPPSKSQNPENAFTLQIGDPNTIAELTGIDTVSDFRRRDVAAGGQGAPLVPAFHAAAFSKAGQDRVIVNIGGMANITVLRSDGGISGFDSGPGNVLMDAWIQKIIGEDFDRDGQWAASGKVLPHLVKHYLDDHYFAQTGPKSTGREQFNLSALEKALASTGGGRAEDVQHSLMQVTAQSISQAILSQRLDQPEVFLCGGGAHNRALREAIQTQLSSTTVATTDALGISPDWVEAAAFAWLAKQSIDRCAGNIPQATGAKGPRILGALYPA